MSGLYTQVINQSTHISRDLGILVKLNKDCPLTTRLWRRGHEMGQIW